MAEKMCAFCGKEPAILISPVACTECFLAFSRTLKNVIKTRRKREARKHK